MNNEPYQGSHESGSEHVPDPDRLWNIGLDWQTLTVPLKVSEAEALLLLEHLEVTLRCYSEQEFSAIRTALERIHNRLSGLVDHPSTSGQSQQAAGLPTQEDVSRDTTPKIEEQKDGDPSTRQETSGDQTTP